VEKTNWDDMIGSWDSSVGTVTRLSAGDQEIVFDSRQEPEFYFSPQFPSIEWVLESTEARTLS
jgi:hypothetical protein